MFIVLDGQEGRLYDAIFRRSSQFPDDTNRHIVAWAGGHAVATITGEAEKVGP